MERYAYRDVDERVIVVIPGLVQERETEVALERVARRLQHRDAVETRDLRLLVELRGPRCILHRLPREDRADLLLELRDLVSVRRNRLDGPQIQLARQGKAGVRSEPRLERKASLGSEIGPPAVLAHHRVQRRRDVRDVGDHRSLRRIDRILRREDGVHAELRHEPAFLRGGIVVAQVNEIVDRLRSAGLVVASLVAVENEAQLACPVERGTRLGCGITLARHQRGAE